MGKVEKTSPLTPFSANTWLWLDSAAGAFLVATGLWVMFLGSLACGEPMPGS